MYWWIPAAVSAAGGLLGGVGKAIKNSDREDKEKNEEAKRRAEREEERKERDKDRALRRQEIESRRKPEVYQPPDAGMFNATQPVATSQPMSYYQGMPSYQTMPNYGNFSSNQMTAPQLSMPTVNPLGAYQYEEDEEEKKR